MSKELVAAETGKNVIIIDALAQPVCNVDEQSPRRARGNADDRNCRPGYRQRQLLRFVHQRAAEVITELGGGFPVSRS
jgi:hypothetical protein